MRDGRQSYGEFMKIIIPGGTGQVGGLLRRSLVNEGHDVVILSRRDVQTEPGVRHWHWDGASLGNWVKELDGADAVINLAGRSVSCRYTEENLRQMMDSRVNTTRLLGEALATVDNPPPVWLQMSTATIYADRRNGSNDETTGEIGGNEPDVPDYWEYSVRIARRWEEAQLEAELTGTRRVALRTAMVMTPDQGGIFDVLSLFARIGLGGPIAGGGQKVSWIHGEDFVAAVAFLLVSDSIDGPVNLCSPNPVTQKEFMTDLRRVWGRRLALPATGHMAKIGAWALQSDAELLLKSRSVVPSRLLDAGFGFRHALWPGASRNLVEQMRARPEGISLLPTVRQVIKLGRS